MMRKLVPKQVRIATFIAIIATMVTVADYLVKAISIPVYKALGAYIPLIVANCIILERAEAYAGAQTGFEIDAGRPGHGTGLRIRTDLPRAPSAKCSAPERSWASRSSDRTSNLGCLFLLPPGGFISLAIWLLTFATWRERKAKRAVAAARAEQESGGKMETQAVHA